MTTVYLIRHALCDDVGRLLAGRMPGVHLNADGQVQAARLAARLSGTRFAAIYTSPLERARETAEAVAAGRGFEVQARAALLEFRFGDWTGRTVDALEPDTGWRRFNRLRSQARVPAGEMMLEVQARIVAELDRLRVRHRDDRIAVVSHGDVIRAALAHAAGIPLDLCYRLSVDPASVSILTLDELDVGVLTLNDTGRFDRAGLAKT